MENPSLNPCPLPSVGPFQQRSRRKDGVKQQWKWKVFKSSSINKHPNSEVMETIPFLTRRPLMSFLVGYKYIYIQFTYKVDVSSCSKVSKPVSTWNHFMKTIQTCTTVPWKTRTSGSCGTSVFETGPVSICGTFPSAFPAQKRGFQNVVPNGSKWPWGHSKYVSWAPKIPSLNHPCLYKMDPRSDWTRGVGSPIL